LVKIRLKRMGAKKRPFYRLVVADARSPRDGRFIEALGHYDPLSNPAKVTIDEEKVRDWIRKGARPSDSARRLLQREGIIAKPAGYDRHTVPSKKDAAAAEAAEKAEKAAAEKQAAAAVAVAEPETEAVAEEAPEVTDSADEAAPAADEAVAEPEAAEAGA
jgi:small subunit ribosomal protein S16